MTNALRSIITIVIAFVAFGWVTAAPVQEYASTEAAVVLEAMPEIPSRLAPRHRSQRYRTPFVIPISSADWGTIQGPPARRVKLPLVRTTPATSSEPDPLNLLPSFPHPVETQDVYAWMSTRGLSAARVLSLSWATPTSPAKSISVSAVGPNLTGLAERVALHNLGVSAIEDQLRARDTWKLSDLESLLAQLRSQHESRRLWMLYWQLLDTKQQWRVGSPVAYTKCIDLLRQRLFETRVAMDINPFSVTTAGKRQATQRLEEISRQLDELEAPHSASHE